MPALPITPSTHHIFAVFRQNTAHFIPDSGATHILVRASDSDVLDSITHYTPSHRRPHFEVANGASITPIASGFLRFPQTTVTVRAFIFDDEDLSNNLFGLAPLIQQGCTATFTNTDFTIQTPHHVLIYGTKSTTSNTWWFSLPKPHDLRAGAVIRHEQHAEIVLFAYATFGSPAYPTF